VTERRKSRNGMESRRVFRQRVTTFSNVLEEEEEEEEEEEGEEDNH
jgi:hypothetical protein